MGPAAEDHVEVAIGVGGDPAWPVGAPGQPWGRRDDLERVRVEALDPSLDRRRLNTADGDAVAERV